MNLPLEMGRAGLGLISFLIVLGLAVLVLARPEVGTPAFVMTILILAVAVATGVVLMLAMRRTVRSSNPLIKEGHHE